MCVIVFILRIMSVMFSLLFLCLFYIISTFIELHSFLNHLNDFTHLFDDFFYLYILTGVLLDILHISRRLPISAWYIFEKLWKDIFILLFQRWLQRPSLYLKTNYFSDWFSQIFSLRFIFISVSTGAFIRLFIVRK